VLLVVVTKKYFCLLLRKSTLHILSKYTSIGKFLILEKRIEKRILETLKENKNKNTNKQRNV